MSNFQSKLSPLRKHIWALAAFLVPLAIRSIPQILSWPYLMGLDTLRYVPVIQSGVAFSSGLLGFLDHQLFYGLATIVNGLVDNPVLILQVAGPLLMGFVAFFMYLYARRGLGWTGFKSFLVALLVASYFVALRNSWDLYAQSTALIFLLATLVVFKSFNSKWRHPLTFGLMLLTALSHELVAVILFFALGFEALRFLVKGLKRDFLYLFASLALVFGLFLFARYSPETGTIVIPIVTIASEPSVDLALHIGGLLFYCCGLILPLVILGFRNVKDWVLRSWMVLCVGIPVLTMVLTTTPLYYWNRWVYLLVYPLIFFAVSGLDKLWRYWSANKNRIKKFVPKVLAIVYVLLLLCLSGFYLTSDPDNQISFFVGSGYLGYIPSSMLQNTLPIGDNPSLVHCFQWINDNTSNDSVAVMHYALYDLAYIYLENEPIAVREGLLWDYVQNQTSLVDRMITEADVQLSNGYSAVYTVWWANGLGWYEIPSLPSSFHLVYQSGIMGVYTYESN